MTKKINPIILSIIISFGMITFTSCNKENEVLKTRHSNTPTQKSGEPAHIVALSNSTSLIPGDELDLTFDKDIFFDEYIQTLNDSTNHQWVAEDARAFIHSLGPKGNVPILQVSAYDVDDEIVSNTFIILHEIDNPEGGKCYTASRDTNITLKCIGSGVCSSGEVCYPIYTNGIVDCTPCISTLGTCTRDITVTITTSAIFTFIEKHL